jgi:hypothetical protein
MCERSGPSGPCARNACAGSAHGVNTQNTRLSFGKSENQSLVMPIQHYCPLHAEPHHESSVVRTRYARDFPRAHLRSYPDHGLDAQNPDARLFRGLPRGLDRIDRDGDGLECARKPDRSGRAGREPARPGTRKNGIGLPNAPRSGRRNRGGRHDCLRLGAGRVCGGCRTAW